MIAPSLLEVKPLFAALAYKARGTAVMRRTGAATARRRAHRLSRHVIQPPQPLGDDVAEPLQLGLIADRAGLDAKREQHIPWIETVDGHGNSAPGTAFYYVAEILKDHLRQFFGCFRLLFWI